MVQNENQKAFQERLAKIEARQNADETMSAKFKRGQKNGAQSQKRRGKMMMTIVLLLGIAALPFLHQKYPDFFVMPNIAALLEQSDAEGQADS